MQTVKKILKGMGLLIGLILVLFVMLVVVPEKETVLAIEPRETTRYWEMSEGFRIAYTHLERQGEEEKYPVVFLHGGPGGYIHSSLIEVAQNFSMAGHDVYLYDQRGSGLSDRLDEFSAINFAAHVRDLHEIIDQKIDQGKVILIGQSFGSTIISHYSATYPETIAKIVFTSPGGIEPLPMENGGYVDLAQRYPIPDTLHFIESYDFSDDTDAVAIRPKSLVSVTGAMLLGKKLISDRQMDRILNTLASKFTRGMVCDESNVQPEEGGGGFYAFLATNQDDGITDVRAQIRTLEMPVLVIQGQCDYIPYSDAYEYVDLYPNSLYHFIENAGHEIWWEQPDAYVEAIQLFLAEQE